MESVEATLMALEAVGRVLSLLQQGTFSFKPDGTPTCATAEVVRKLIDDLCPADGSWTCDDLRAGMEAALYQWLIDSRTANDNLRRIVINLLLPDPAARLG